MNSRRKKPQQLHFLAATVTIFMFPTTGYVADYAPADITDLILVTGQSNVTGSQTQYNSSLDGSDPRVFAFTSAGTWEIADLHQAWDVDGWHPGNGSLADDDRNPYNHFGFHFAKTITKADPSRVVGIVVASAPGEGIKHWDANSAFSQIIDSKVVDALNAQGVKSQLDGILWHQGETDWQFHGTSDTDATVSEKNQADYYSVKLDALIQRFRSEIWFANQKPFICGETKQAHVNGRLMALNIDSDNWTGCVPARDLCTREQNTAQCNDVAVLGTHFNASGLRTLGERYAYLYLALQGQSNTSVQTCNGRIVTVDLNAGETTTSGDDVVMGTPGRDIIRAKAGNDTICGMGGDDFIHGNSGDDWIDGGAGIDNLRGGQGSDTIYTGSGETVGTSSRAFGGIGDDYIYGGPDSDDLRGGRGNDTILGGDGNDEIFGNEGNDALFGFGGSDSLKGGTGETDRLHGGSDTDTLNGGAGNSDYCGDGADAQSLCEVQ